MSSWTDSTLSDVVLLQRGHDLPASSRGAGQVPVIGSFGITGHHDIAKYQGPGVAIGRSGASIGVATYCPEDYWPLNTCLFVKDFKGNDRRWVFYLLDSIDFTAYNSGSAQPSLNRNYLSLIPVSLPPAEEQRGIAATLGALDDKIESNRRSIELASLLLDAIAADSGPNLQPTKLADLVETPKDTVNPATLGGAVVDLFSLPAFDDGGRPERVSANTIMSNKQAVPGRSILLSRLNPRINRTWWVSPDVDVHALSSTEFLCVRAGSDLELAAVWLALRTVEFRSELPRRVTGTSGSHQRVRPQDVLDIDVPNVAALPRSTKQTALSLLEGNAQKLREVACLAALRDALLAEMLSGRIRVPEAQEALAGVSA